MTYPRRRRSDQDRDETPHAPLKALLVDDDVDYLTFIALLAHRAGFNTETAADGEKALEKLAAADFDLLMVDCEMPRLSGMDLIGMVRTAEKNRNAYAVMLTARDDAETKIKALTAGYDNFLTKGCTDLEIIACLAAAQRVIYRQLKLDDDLRELYRLATGDELTGLANRRFLTEEAARILKGTSVVTVVIFDLDDFKKINDTHGHLVGDSVLRDIGAQFLKSTRSEDLVARYGGDEFVMVMTDLSLQDSEVMAQRLAGEIAALRWRAGGQEIRISASMGIAASTLLVSPTIEQLLEAADRDLYKNKWIRKNPDRNPELYEYPPAEGRTISHPASDATIPVKKQATAQPE